MQEVEKVSVQRQVASILNEVLSLNGRASGFDRETQLLGALPELDSMAVVALITSLEDRVGIVIDDDAIDGGTFATFGSLVDFVTARIGDGH